MKRKQGRESGEKEKVKTHKLKKRQATEEGENEMKDGKDTGTMREGENEKTNQVKPRHPH
jgi:hypothetical protein